MPVYTLEDLITECSSGRSRIDLPARKKRAVYADAWESLNRWVDSQFEKGQGVNIANFCKITWETVARSLSGDERRRPYFALHDSFCRANGLPVKVKGSGAHPDESLAKCADINFSVLAIKHSTSLTKDQAFSAMRDIVQKLGQVFGSGRKVVIDMHVGRLVARERKVTLLFDVKRFRDYLQTADAGADADANSNTEQWAEEVADSAANADADTDAGAGGAMTMDGDEQDEIDRLAQQVGAGAGSADAAAVPSLDLQAVGPSTGGEALAAGTATATDSAAGAGAGAGEELAAQLAPAGPQDHPADADADELVDAVGTFNATLGGGDGGGGGGSGAGSALSDAGISQVASSQAPFGATNKNEAVLESAYKRFLAQTQDMVDEEDRMARAHDEQHFQREMLARMRARERAEERKANQAVLLQQLADKRKADIQAKADAMVDTRCSLPMEAAAFQVDDDALTTHERAFEAQQKAAKEDLLRSLQYQMRDKRERKAAQKRFEQEEERRFLRHVASEVQTYQSEKEMEAAMKRKDLVDAWDRDKFCKQLLRMRKEQLVLRRPDPFKTAKASQLGAGVGFDMRGK